MIIVGTGSSSTVSSGGQFVQWIVELDADPDTTGQFMVGSSLLGGSDNVAPDERWIAVPTLRVKSASVRRGGGQGNRAYDAGECVVELDNSSGDFDPDNPGSVYVMGPRQLLTQGTGLRVRASAGGTISTYPNYDAAVAGDGALSYWKLDETSGTLADDSRGANDGAYAGSYSLNAASLGVGLGAATNFTGGNLAVPAPASALNAPFTAEMWFSFPSASAGNYTLLSTRLPDELFEFLVASDGSKFTQLLGRVGNGTTAINTAMNATGLTIAFDSANHVAYVVDATTYTIYLNGVSVGSGSLSSTGTFWNTANGMRVVSSPFQPTGLGRVSNVAVYPSALSAPQVAEHYALGVSPAAVTQTLFTGRLGNDGIVLGGHWAAPTATLTATDLLDALSGVDVPAQGGQTGSGESSSVRAHWLLDQAGVPTSKRSIQSAGRQCLGTTGGGTVREALDQVANGEAGRFFVDRTGVVTMTWHDAEYGKSSQIDYANTGTNPKYESIEASTGAAGVTNTAVVKRIVPKVRNEDTGQFEDGPDLPDAGATEWESVAAYGTRSVTAEVVLQNDSDVQELASFLANRRSQPIPRITTLVSVPLEAMTTDQALSVLEVELGDLITLSQRTIDGRVREWAATVENIAFDHSSPMTTVKFSTAPSDTAAYDAAGWFLIGSSLLGGTDVLAPF